MNKRQIDKIFERLVKMDPKPVITVTDRRFKKDKKYHLHRRTGVFGWWNGSVGSFEVRKSKTRKLRGVFFFKPFYRDEIVSIKITTEQEMIDDRNSLFELLEHIEKRK